MKQFKLYKITQISTNAVYIGIIIKKNKKLKDRLIEHVTHRGSVMISELIVNGSEPNDFVIELLHEYDRIDDVYVAEVETIAFYKQHCISLNKNGGGGFSGKKFFYDSSFLERGWDVNIYNDKSPKTEIQKLIETKCSNSHLYKRLALGRGRQVIVSNYLRFLFDFYEIIIVLQKKYKLLRIYKTIKRFNNIKVILKAFILYKDYEKFYNYLIDVKDDDIATFIYVCENYLKNNVNTLSKRNKRNKDDDFMKSFFTHNHANLLDSFREQYGHNGYTLKMQHLKEKDSFFDSFFGCNHANLLDSFREQYGTKINSAEETEAWKLGRIRFAERCKAGIKTENEIIANFERKEIIKNDWAKRDEAYIVERTMPGLNTMNGKIHTCKVCGMTGLTLGNLNRWHNDRCKAKQE